VAVKGKSSKVILEVEVDLADYGETINTKEELLEYYKSYYGYQSEEHILSEKYAAENYKQILVEIENGHSVIIGKFSSDSGNALEQYLCDTGLQEAKSKSVVVIQSEAGY
jgi:hypothetical protein